VLGRPPSGWALRRRRARAGRAGAGAPQRNDAAPDQPGGAARPAAPPPSRPRTSVALPRTDLRVVDPVAAGVTNQALVSFPGFMRLPRILVVVPIWFLLTADTPTPATTPSATASPSP